MQPARVWSPSISFVAHLTAAAILVAASALATGPRPPIADPPIRVATWPDAATGGGGAPLAHKTTVVPASMPTPPPRVDAPLPPAPVESIALSEGDGIEGLPPDLLPGSGRGDGPGLCLSNCGTRPETQTGSVIPPVEQETHEPVRLHGGDVRAPVKSIHVAPAYPPLALATRVQGSVVIDCVIDQAGRVTSVRALSGHPLLVPAALEAVRQWRYTPTLLNGSPVAVLLEVTVAFRLTR